MAVISLHRLFWNRRRFRRLRRQSLYRRRERIARCFYANAFLLHWRRPPGEICRPHESTPSRAEQAPPLNPYFIGVWNECLATFSGSLS